MKSADELMDMLVMLENGQQRNDVRSEIRKRCETPSVAAPDVTSPDAIVLRAVAELRNAGWWDVADACIVLFARALGISPEVFLPLIQADATENKHNGHLYPGERNATRRTFLEAETNGLAYWIVGCAKDCSQPLQYSPPRLVTTCRVESSHESI
jgi:hypothetical protein